MAGSRGQRARHLAPAFPPRLPASLPNVPEGARAPGAANISNRSSCAEEARPEGDRLSGEPVRVAAAVVALVMVPDHRQGLARAAQRAADLLETRCWNPDIGALTQVAGEPQLDAALLLAVHLGYFGPDDPRAASHVDAIREHLSVDGGLLRRYSVGDDFGHMEAAFTVCTRPDPSTCVGAGMTVCLSALTR